MKSLARRRWTAWWLAARPRTLVAGLVPVAVGSGLAFARGQARPLIAAAAAAVALLIQVGTNLANDYFDNLRGADTDDRLGPARACQQGWIAPRSVWRAALGCFGAALAVGAFLIGVGGWPVVGIGLTSVLAGYAYTGGPFPLAYLGLGEVFVFVFFGLVAVGGTYFVQALSLDWIVVAAALPVGALGTCILIVNNLRDIATDERAGKRTLAVRFGVWFTRIEYLALLLLAFACPLALWLAGVTKVWVLAPLLAAPLAAAPARAVLVSSGAALNTALAATAKLEMVFGLLFTLGLAAERLG